MGERGSGDLPPGFHFVPSDEELVLHFLYRKAARLPCHPDIIPTIDLHQCDPWNLTGKALQGGDKFWYFFTSKLTDQHRASVNGYWDTVGTDEVVSSGNKDDIVGVKKTFRYYIGEHPQGIRTDWVMHEYHLLDGVLGASSSGGISPPSSSTRTRRKRAQQLDFNKWVMCRVHESTAGGGGGSQASLHDVDGVELSCLDEVFLSLDDLDEVSLPNEGHI